MVHGSSGSQINVQLRETSQVEGFETIAVEKRPKMTAEFDEDFFSESANNLNTVANRVGRNLK